MPPAIGELFKCECGNILGRRTGFGEYKITKQVKRETVTNIFQIISKPFFPSQVKFICGICGLGHIVVGIVEELGVQETMEMNVESLR